MSLHCGLLYHVDGQMAISFFTHFIQSYTYHLQGFCVIDGEQKYSPAPGSIFENDTEISISHPALVKRWAPAPDLDSD